MNADKCPVCGCTESIGGDYYRAFECGMVKSSGPQPCAKAEHLAIERAKEIETLTKNLADAQGDNSQEAMENKQLAEQVENLKAEIERLKSTRIEIPPPPEGFEAVLHLPQMSGQCSQADFELTSQGWKKPCFGISSEQIIARKKEMMK